MTGVDTSTEAVMLLADQHTNTANSDYTCRDDLREWHRETAATLRALAAERDAAWKSAETLTGAVERLSSEVTAAEAARDRIAAEREKLRGALLKIRDLGLGPDRGSAQWQIDTAREISRAALTAKEPQA